MKMSSSHWNNSLKQCERGYQTYIIVLNVVECLSNRQLQPLFSRRNECDQIVFYWMQVSVLGFEKQGIIISLPQWLHTFWNGIYSRANLSYAQTMQIDKSITWRGCLQNAFKRTKMAVRTRALRCIFCWNVLLTNQYWNVIKVSNNNVCRDICTSKCHVAVITSFAHLILLEWFARLIVVVRS